MSKQIALPIVVVVVAIALGSYVQGTLVDRWGHTSTGQLKKYEERLKLVPAVIGEWESYELEDDPEQLKAARITGSVSRAYRNRTTGEAVSLFLVCGKAVNIAEHTPDQCFVAAGYTMLSEPNPYKIETDLVPGNFNYTVFQKDEPDRTHRQRIFWTWHDDEEPGFQAPSNPTWSFVGKPALYKMYIMSELGSDPPPLEESPIIHFSREALPVLEEVLFPAEPETGEPNDVTGAKASSGGEA